MTRISIVFGILLTVLGVGMFVLTNHPTYVSWTPIIPAFFGVVLALLGWLGEGPGEKPYAMHIAAVVAALGAGMAVVRLRMLPRQWMNGVYEMNNAQRETLLMGLTCLVFVIICLISFVRERQGRTDNPSL